MATIKLTCEIDSHGTSWYFIYEDNKYIPGQCFYGGNNICSEEEKQELLQRAIQMFNNYREGKRIGNKVKFSDVSIIMESNLD